MLGACLALSGGLGDAERGVAAQFIAPEGSDYHNGATLPLEDDGEARGLVQRLQAALDRADGDGVAAELRALRARPEVSLVPFGPRTHVAALDLAARMVLDKRVEGVLDRVREDVSAVLAEALRRRDLEALLDLSMRGSALPGADEAALAAARLLFERGEWYEAAVLGARAGSLPGADALTRAARAHLVTAANGNRAEADAPGESARPEDYGLEGGLQMRMLVDREGGVSLPVASDGLPRELVVMDAIGLVAIARETGQTTRSFGDWGVSALAAIGPRRYPPAPRRVSAARSGSLLVLPFSARSDLRWEQSRAPRDARLLAVDLAGSDALAWVGQAAATPDVSTAYGPPLVVGSRAYVQVFRVGLQTEVSLACFALEDGRLLFETPLVRAAQVRRYASRLAETSLEDMDKRACEGPPAERDGLIWVSTGHGVVAVVDGVTGWLRHTFKYDRVHSQEAFQYEPAFLYENAGWDEDIRALLYGDAVEPYALRRSGGWDDEPVRFFGNRVVVAPRDSRFLYVLASEPGSRGHVILDDPIEQLDRREIVALLPDPTGSDSPAFLCTRRSGRRSGLVLLAPGGAVLAATPWMDPGAMFTGRPVTIGRNVFVPTAVGTLAWRLDELQAPPVRLPRAGPVPEGVAAAFALSDGLVTFSPFVNAESQEAAWFVQWYRASR
ncbi:MAG: hypothetical protein ACYTG2_15120 [Planctomycetota bacterium]